MFIEHKILLSGEFWDSEYEQSLRLQSKFLCLPKYLQELLKYLTDKPRGIFHGWVSMKSSWQQWITTKKCTTKIKMFTWDCVGVPGPCCCWSMTTCGHGDIQKQDTVQDHVWVHGPTPASFCVEVHGPNMLLTGATQKPGIWATTCGLVGV